MPLPITNLRDYEHQARATLVRAGLLFVGFASFVSAAMIGLPQLDSVPHRLHAASVAMGGIVALATLCALNRLKNPSDYSNVSLLVLMLSIYVPNLVGYYFVPFADQERTLILVSVLFGATCLANWRFFLVVYGVALLIWYLISVDAERVFTYADLFYLCFLVPAFGLIGGRAMFNHQRRVFELHRSLEQRANELAQAKQLLVEEKRLREAEEEKRREGEAIIEQQAEQLRHVSRTSTMGEMVASIAHEINQPLNAMGMCSGLLLLDDVPQEERNAAARQINHLVKLCGTIIQRLRRFVRRDSTSESPVSLHQVIQDSIALVASSAKRHQIEIAFDSNVPPQTSMVSANEVELQQVVVNLLQNSIEAMSTAIPTTGETNGIETRFEPIQVRLKQQEGWLQVSVQDRGGGLDASVSQTMFEPFVTSKASGMGMGLAISRSILERHRGTISAQSNGEQGTTFSFLLPQIGAARELTTHHTLVQSVQH